MSAERLNCDVSGESLDGRVIVVSGGGSISEGIGNGRASAVVLAKAGARIAVIDKDVRAAKKTVSMIEDGGGEGLVFTANVADPEECASAVNRVVEKFGPIYGLVNNVGIGGPPGNALEVDPVEWDSAMAINVKSMMLMSKFCLPYMLDAGEGSIVNMASVAGLKGGITSLLYPTSKAAVIGLTQAMAAHHGRQGVRINCIAPGMVYTPMVSSRGMSDDLRASRRDRSLLGTEGSGWDVAYGVRYLLSFESRWVTGITLPIDAGASSGTPTYPTLPSQLIDSQLRFDS